MSFPKLLVLIPRTPSLYETGLVTVTWDGIFLIKKPLGYTAFEKDLSMAKMNLPMDDQV